MRDKSRPGLIQRGEHWHVAIYPPKGSSAKPFRKGLGTKDHALAAQWYDAHAGQIRQDFWREANGFKQERTWEEAAAVYYEESERTDWGPDAERFRWCNSKLNGRNLTEISREFWKGITDQRREETIKERGKCAGGTLNRRTAIVTAVLTVAARKLQWIQTVPLLYTYPESDPRERVYSMQECAAITGRLADWASSMFRFTLATGLRQGNVRALRWDWIDMQNRIIRIPRQEFKQRKVHVQVLNDTAAAVIRAQPGFIQPVGERQPLVFLRDGEPISKGTLRHEWDDTIASLGLEDAHWHDSRRTWATMLRELGVSLDDAMVLGGWSSKDMLQEVYSKPSVGFLLGKARTLDDVLHTITPHALEAVG